MASEKRGILYEAMLYRSLLSLRKKALISANIYWNQTPFNMKIDTDITIGSSADSPSHLFLISHSTAEHNSEMKFWRNMGEIREAKVRLPSNPFVIGVLFDAKVKKNLLKIQPYAFDQFLIIEWRDYGKNIIDFSSEFSERAPQEKNDKLRFLEENINSDSGLKTSLENLENDLLSSISQPSYSSSLWKAVREYTDKRGKGRIPASRETSLRRGLAKLLVFDEIPAKEAIIEDFYLDLRIGKKSLLGTRISDQDILNVLNLLNTLELTQLHYHYSSMKAFSILVKPLRTIAIFDKLWNELNSKWNLMTEGSTLFKFLKSSHENPIKTLDLQPSEASYVIPGWPVIFLITILKASFERRMAFGYSKIVNDIEKLSSSEKYAIIASSLGNHQNAKNTSSVRSSRTIEYGLRDWIFGEDRDNFNLQDCELALVAEVIARRIRKKVGFTLDSNLSRLVKEYFVSDTIETKLLSHPSFQPLKKICRHFFMRRYSRMPHISGKPYYWVM
jgi:hypothetical protein